MMGRRFRFRGLFQKYLLVLFLAVVVPLAANGVSEAWFGYRDQRARLDQLLGVQATARRRPRSRVSSTASPISLAGWFSFPGRDEPDERRRTDALRLLRQVPAIVSLTLVDGVGTRAPLRLADRPQPDRKPHRPLRAIQPWSAPAAARIWFGDVSYNRGSEPYLTVAICRQPTIGRRGRRRGQSQADLGRDLGHQGRRAAALPLCWIGPGRLIAHPDISLVLRGADDATLPAFQAHPRRDRPPARGVATRRDAQGNAVAAAAAPVAGPGWTVVVEQPLSEAFGPIYAALWRTAGFSSPAPPSQASRLSSWRIG